MASRILGHEPDEAFRLQSLPEPSAVDGVGNVEYLRLALSKVLPHLASVEHEDIEVAHRGRPDDEPGHGGRKTRDD